MLQSYSGSLKEIVCRVDGRVPKSDDGQVLVELDPRTLDVIRNPRWFSLKRPTRYLVASPRNGKMARFELYLVIGDSRDSIKLTIRCAARCLPGQEIQVGWALAGERSPLDQLYRYFSKWTSGTFWNPLFDIHRSGGKISSVAEGLTVKVQEKCRESVGLYLRMKTGEPADVRPAGVQPPPTRPEAQMVPIIPPNIVPKPARATAKAQIVPPPSSNTSMNPWAAEEAIRHAKLGKLKKNTFSVETEVSFHSAAVELRYCLRFRVLDVKRGGREDFYDQFAEETEPRQKVEETVRAQFRQFLTGEQPDYLESLADRDLLVRLTEELPKMVGEEIGLEIKIFSVERLGTVVEAAHRDVRNAWVKAEKERVLNKIDRAGQGGQLVEEGLRSQIAMGIDSIQELEKRRLMLIKNGEDAAEVQRLDEEIRKLRQRQAEDEKQLDTRKEDNMSNLGRSETWRPSMPRQFEGQASAEIKQEQEGQESDEAHPVDDGKSSTKRRAQSSGEVRS